MVNASLGDDPSVELGFLDVFLADESLAVIPLQGVAELSEINPAAYQANLQRLTDLEAIINAA